MTSSQVKQQIQPQIPFSLEPLDSEQVQEVIDMLNSWCDVDEEEANEQRETLEYLMKALDEKYSS
ncbi:hypothetical protein BCD67_00775 [Oscillatoriales cyanobacterium USR001]|nr:hypothetical protein BCD67_00775 [Oscillatoriales cyanobacterium USR001]